MGGTCDLHGWTKKWCFVDPRYEGVGREFVRQSIYEGKFFTICGGLSEDVVDISKMEVPPPESHPGQAMQAITPELANTMNAKLEKLQTQIGEELKEAKLAGEDKDTLKKELGKRGLPTDGTKEECAERLAKDEANHKDPVKRAAAKKEAKKVAEEVLRNGGDAKVAAE